MVRPGLGTSGAPPRAARRVPGEGISFVALGEVRGSGGFDLGFRISAQRRCKGFGMWRLDMDLSICLVLVSLVAREAIEREGSFSLLPGIR